MEKVENDSFFLSLAINEAWKFQGLTYPNPAVGAVVVKDGKILAIDCHKKAGTPHAEVLAIRSAFCKLHPDPSRVAEISVLESSLEIHEYLYSNHDAIFKECTIYSTLEPFNNYGKTPPCSQLIKTLGFKKAIFGSYDTGDESGCGLKTLLDSGVDCVGGVMVSECDELIRPFVNWQKGRFVFFKYAQTLNGSIGPGKVSNSNAFEMVHALRDRIDLLIIGGETVRSDRPTLDSRLISGHAPDVMIYSKNDDFDRSIPLFDVPNRDVFISSTLDIPDRYKFVMIEGGGGTLFATKEICDAYLIFLSPVIMNGFGLKCDNIELEFINYFNISNNLAIWAKRRVC